MYIASIWQWPGSLFAVPLWVGLLSTIAMAIMSAFSSKSAERHPCTALLYKIAISLACWGMSGSWFLRDYPVGPSPTWSALAPSLGAALLGGVLGGLAAILNVRRMKAEGDW